MPASEDKFTPRLRQALVLASQEALRLGQAATAPEHILLGLLREGTGLAAEALTNLEVDTNALRGAIEARLEPQARPKGAGSTRYTRETEEILKLAASEARELKHDYIGQEHVLLALLRQKDGPVAKALAEFYVTYDLAREQVVAILTGQSWGKTKLKRYNLALPEDLFREVEHLADQEHTTVLEVLRRSVKLGLLVARVQQTPGAAVIIREGNTERQLVLL